MSINYSLICWGGSTGKTVSISATTDLCTTANPHWARNGKKVWPAGTLPAELSTGTAVYIRSVSSTTFTLHTSETGAKNGTGQITFAGSGTYASVRLIADEFQQLSSTSRWGSRIYDGLTAWKAARSPGANDV